MGLPEVSETLWRERELLELLVFKLDIEQLLAESVQVRWQGHAGREVDLLLEEIRRTELLRAVQTEAVAAELGLAPAVTGVTLHDLARAAGEPWCTILQDHRDHLIAATAEVAAACRTSSLRRLEEAL